MPTPFSQRAMAVLAERRIRAAVEAGELDGLRGEGRPIALLDTPYEPDWWVKRWLERERHGDLAGRGRRAQVAAVEAWRAQRLERDDR